MQLIPDKTNINFMSKRVPAIILSLIVMAISIGALVTKGLNFGIDFTGGTLIEVGYAESVELSKVREALAGDFSDAQVQHFGSSKDVMIRIAPREGENSAALSSRVLTQLQQTGDVEMRRVEFVGPQVGEELTEQGGLALLYAIIGILIYVYFRFQWQFSLGSVAALVHDVIITLGLFSIIQMEFDLTVLAALLAVIGYSLNDTIVVFDRIRENFRKMRKGTPEDVMNASINQTLSRTIMTGVTTLLVLLALYILGGEVIHAFAFALIAGIVVGTYSSIYIASAVALYLGVNKQDLMPVQKEGVEAEEKP